MTTKFAEVLAETKDNRTKSELSNLAHAKLAIQQQINDLKALDAKIDAAAAKVEAGETPDDDILTLYQKAHGRR